MHEPPCGCHSPPREPKAKALRKPPRSTKPCFRGRFTRSWHQTLSPSLKPLNQLSHENHSRFRCSMMVFKPKSLLQLLREAQSGPFHLLLLRKSLRLRGSRHLLHHTPHILVRDELMHQHLHLNGVDAPLFVAICHLKHPKEHRKHTKNVAFSSLPIHFDRFSRIFLLSKSLEVYNYQLAPLRRSPDSCSPRCGPGDRWHNRYLNHSI